MSRLIQRVDRYMSLLWDGGLLLYLPTYIDLNDLISSTKLPCVGIFDICFLAGTGGSVVGMASRCVKEVVFSEINMGGNTFPKMACYKIIPCGTCGRNRGDLVTIGRRHASETAQLGSAQGARLCSCKVCDGLGTPDEKHYRGLQICVFLDHTHLALCLSIACTVSFRSSTVQQYPAAP